MSSPYDLNRYDARCRHCGAEFTFSAYRATGERYPDGRLAWTCPAGTHQIQRKELAA